MSRDSIYRSMWDACNITCLFVLLFPAFSGNASGAESSLGLGMSHILADTELRLGARLNRIWVRDWIPSGVGSNWISNIPFTDCISEVGAIFKMLHERLAVKIASRIRAGEGSGALLHISLFLFAKNCSKCQIRGWFLKLEIFCDKAVKCLQSPAKMGKMFRITYGNFWKNHAELQNWNLMQRG